MANNINIDIDKDKFIAKLQKGVQSANLNFLIGSGCSLPAIKTLGNIEKEIDILLKSGNNDEAEIKTFEFIKPFVVNTDILLIDEFLAECQQERNCDTLKTYKNYQNFIDTISKLLFERKSNILHKQATIFTTNYDLFIERVAENHTSQLNINDGFQRSCSLKQKFKFSASNFFNVLYSTGNIYNYQVEIPTINLIKLHGSINWEICNGIIFNSLNFLERAKELKEETEINKIEEFNNLFSIILPKKDKFKETLLNQVYYDMLRLFANELDKENTLLIADGFSFDDEHIFEIIKRALKNPTLKLIIFSWDINPENFKNKFQEFNNVEIVYSENENITFEKFNELLKNIIPEDKVPIYKVKIVNTELEDE